MTAPGRTRRVLRGLGALAVLIVIVAGVPLLALAVQHLTNLHVLPHRIPSLADIGHGLTQRDHGQLVAVVLAAGVWICWALFILSLAAETVAAVRKRPVRHLPLFGAFQHPAGALIAAVALVFTVAPLAGSATTAARASAAPVPPLPAAQTVHSAPAASGTATEPSPGHAAESTVHTPADARSTPTQTYEVQPRDTLWKIAEDHLGDPMRYPEIVALNPSRIGPDNDISPGTVLAMPADATGLQDTSGPSPHAATQVHVQEGDTLWGIEQRVTGTGQNWTEAWDANKGRVEPGGDRFDDPSRILPGWTLSIPTHGPVEHPAPPPPARPTSPTAPRPAPPASHPAPSAPTHPRHQEPTPSTPATPAPTSTSNAGPQHAHDEPATRQPAVSQSSNRYASFEVGGGLLAAVAVAALMVHRRRKFRHRRLGHAVASLPQDLVPLEQALLNAGRPSLAKMTFLDLALRQLATLISADPRGVLPDVVGACINDEYLELYLAGEADDPPEPWIATSSTRWTLGRGAELTAAAGRRLAPYPCLVSVGYTADGSEYLLDLEHVGAIELVGDATRCLDLARYMVAELANNVWSDNLTVTVAGFAGELVSANPQRMSYTDDAAAAAASLTAIATANLDAGTEAGVDVLEGRLTGTAADAWMPQVLLVAPGQLAEGSSLDDLARASKQHGRAAVAVVTGGRDQAAASVQLTVTEHGTLATSLLPVADLTAFGLPTQNAAEMARAIALDRDGALDEPIPASDGGRPWDSFTDAAGALLPEYTAPRTPSGPAVVDAESATNSCVLPGPDEVYVDAAATTVEDLAAVAPSVPAATRAAVEEADPDLDELVQAWFDSDSGLAKLDVLAHPTIALSAPGRPPAKEEDLVVEIVTYLWQHPHGVTTDQFADALWPDHNYDGTDSRPKNMASIARQWLGIDPRTGTEYFPRATRGGLYRVDGLLVSWDLFRRLRTRGTARGVEGRADLVAALRFASGPPMAQLRAFGYRWLPPGEDMLYMGAIAEVAHTVANFALEAGDYAQAIDACEIALGMDEEDERALVTIAKAHAAAGQDAEKDATILRLRMLEDPTERTLEVMRRNGWLARGA